MAFLISATDRRDELSIEVDDCNAAVEKALELSGQGYEITITDLFDMSVYDLKKVPHLVLKYLKNAHRT